MRETRLQVDLSSISTENTDLTTEINDFENGYIATQKHFLLPITVSRNRLGAMSEDEATRL